MNALRAQLSRGSGLSRCLFLLVFTVLISRALVSSVVMFDLDDATGSLDLVMCSGHGAMFPAGEDGKAMSMSMPGMVMDGHAAADPHDTTNDSTDSNSLCPFSAAFAVGITALAAVIIFLGVVVTRPLINLSRKIIVLPSTPRYRPPGQAPPFAFV